MSVSMRAPMRAFMLTADGPALVEAERPRPQASEVLVRVRASALNRADLALAGGRPHGALGGVGTPLGLEWAGEVVEVGAQVQGFRAGDRVMCSGAGAFADYAVADWRRCFAWPDPQLDWEAGAGLTIALRTAYVAMVMLGQLARGQSVLVLGASSGVGLMCLQLARECGAGLCIGTSTHAQRRGRLAGFGADLALDTGEAPWADQVLAATGGRGVDLVVDFLSGPVLNAAMRATALGGRIVNVGRLAGEQGQFDFELHALRRIQYLGQTFRTRTAEEVGAIGQQLVAALWPALQAGRLRLPVDIRLPLAQANEALALMRSNAHFGKIVLTP